MNNNPPPDGLTRFRFVLPDLEAQLLIEQAAAHGQHVSTYLPELVRRAFDEKRLAALDLHRHGEH